MRQRVLIAATALLLLPAAGCSRTAGVFSEQNARAHIGMLAGTIGSRAVGTPANAQARAYVIDQLKLYGFDVRVQEADARRAELGRTARVSNVIAVLPGSRTEAVGLVAHYDSVPDAPGATDDGLGVAVALEAARVMAARADRQWTLMVLLTDGEEAGLMGAAALVTDREVTSRLQAYLNLESIGSSGPALLFETGPGNGWLVRPWARTAPHPRGASFGIEVYRRLPNDTDFSILKRAEIPGLNFAPVGDSYAYHTARDTPERLSPRTVRLTGENVVAILSALDRTDVTTRSSTSPTFFDIAGTVGVSYGPAMSWLLAALALVTGVIAWVRLSAAAIRVEGVLRWLLTIVWSVGGAVVVFASMVGTTWALRAAREVMHPWYAYPNRLFLLLVTIALAVGWSISRLGQWLPPRAHGLRHPLVTWSVSLPFWIAMASASLWLTPGAAYLWVLPLLAAGVLLALVPPMNAIAVRAASLVVFGVSATLWLPDTLQLLRFAVALFGRLPVITPVFAYAAVMAAAGLMVVPPLLATVAAGRRLVHPVLVTALGLIAVVVASALAYRAPAYTFDEPLRRHVRALQEAAPESPAVWEIGSTEPGIDLDAGAPGGWAPALTPPSASIPWGRLAHPFVFRTSGPSLGAPPVSLGALAIEPVPGGVELTLPVVPRQPGLIVSFVLPAGLAPSRANLPGVLRLGRWTATYVAPPPEGVVFRASFRNADPARLRDTHVAVTSARFPGGDGWQSLPAWLPRERTVWSATATWAIPAAAGPIAPVATLR